MRRWLVGALMIGMCFFIGCGGNLPKETSGETPVEVTKTVAEIKAEAIAGQIASMSTEEKIGQLLMADFRKSQDGNGMTVLTQDAIDAMNTYQPGGVILFSENLDTLEQSRKLTEDLQKASKTPLFIGIDEEGGLVSRLNKSNIPHETILSAGEMTAPEEAEAAGRSIGTTLAEIGVNVDFAPVADINTNPQNPVIGIRAYSADPDQAAAMVCAFVEGLQETGVSGTVKHFPGHGDTAADSHEGEVFVSHDLARLKATEFVPFQKAIEGGVDLVMVGHINMPNAITDGLPASLSSQAVALLREDLGYNGIVITDAMNMQAITDAYGVGESTVMAVLAGVDIVLMPADLEEAYQALLEAKNTGRITDTRLEESLQRIFSLKYEKGFIAG